MKQEMMGWRWHQLDHMQVICTSLQTDKLITHFSQAGFSSWCPTNSALTLLVGRQEGHSDCKNWVMRCWCGYLSGVTCKWVTFGPADATATPSSLVLLKSRLVLLFWCRLTQVVLKKRPLNGCLFGVIMAVCNNAWCMLGRARITITVWSMHPLSSVMNKSKACMNAEANDTHCKLICVDLSRGSMLK